jgi:hypothetical protein
MGRFTEAGFTLSLKSYLGFQKLNRALISRRPEAVDGLAGPTCAGWAMDQHCLAAGHWDQLGRPPCCHFSWNTVVCGDNRDSFWAFTGRQPSEDRMASEIWDLPPIQVRHLRVCCGNIRGVTRHRG